ncbi:MAG: transposase, partial [Planctomycetota bacterium]
MFRRTDPQATLGSLNVLLSPQKIARLEKNHWAGGFRHKALPVLLPNEETFRPLFCEDNGRPNKPVAATLGVIILKEMFDLTDEAALDSFEFNASWQYALNVDPDEAHLCQKTLHNFRVKMSAAEEQ